MAYRVLTRDEHFQRAGQKRILTLDGGGLRGILSLGMLQRVEALLKERHGNDEAFRLCHYFDLIAGTSTGAIIAAALATGMTVDEVIGHYQKLGREVFIKGWFRKGVVRARYDEQTLITHLKRVFGKDVLLGDDSLQTGLLIVTKRLDSGSVWPLGNNPRGQFFKAKESDTWISNGEYPLWKVVRASTAAPSFFDPEPIQISAQAGKKKVVGTFVDGGVSPYNNPSLQALMYATLDGYKVKWPTGADKLLMISVGTGASEANQAASQIAATGAIRALFSLMDDCAALVETMMQWMSTSPTRRAFDVEIGNLGGDLLPGAPLLTYLRYNVMLSATAIETLHPRLSANVVASLGQMDNPDNLDLLLKLGRKAGSQQILADHFPPAFDLPE
jgi:hypothetical protein